MPQQDPHLPIGMAPLGPVNELYVFLVDRGEGEEQICSYVHPHLGVVMMITGTRGDAENMRPFAEVISRQTGCPIRVVRFTRGEVAVEIPPPAGH